MSADGGQQALPPNLADILSTLSQLAAQTPLQNAQASQYEGISQPSSDDEYHPQLATIATSSTNYAPQPANNDQIIDPATITEWSSGLRCVSKVAAQNPAFGNAIRNMIGNQRRNELDWYTKRQELKKLQAQRGSGHSELSSIMLAIGASTGGKAPQQQSQAEVDAELADFDLKIHRAQAQMNNAMIMELKGLGVPFFGTAKDRLIADDMPKPQALEQQQAPKWSPIITHGELRDLQQRMIQYLEAMYKD